MTKRRARLNDENDPLSSTDRVLSGFEQMRKPTSQKANQTTTQPNDNLTSQKVNKSTIQQNNNSTKQKANKPTTQPDDNLTKQKANVLASQQDSAVTLASVEKPKLRKSTFQISEEVLHHLDKLHLTLQLELGKANAPYKEVIVEEALVQLLESVNSNRVALMEALASRQKSR